ncbi:hypothetical protein INT47_003728 [Mucor saturninus]|uniref:Uncharacterized protein n=1 Tax=Mucor saturninus TaxID=64648 RepID=A0A8H7US27_9FUNG|nr:hypothetical protein INT47_003728 [Mucor saturninus]
MLAVSFFDELCLELKQQALLLLFFVWCFAKSVLLFFRKRFTSWFTSVWPAPVVRLVDVDIMGIPQGIGVDLIFAIEQLSIGSSPPVEVASSCLVACPGPPSEVTNPPVRLPSLPPSEKKGWGCYMLDCVCVTGLPCLGRVPLFALVGDAISHAWLQEHASDLVLSAVSSPSGDNAAMAVSSSYEDNAAFAVSSLYRDNAYSVVSSLYRDNTDSTVSFSYENNVADVVSSSSKDNTSPAVSSHFRDNADEAVSASSEDNAFPAVSFSAENNADDAVSSSAEDNAFPAVSSLFRDNAEEAVSFSSEDNAFPAVSFSSENNAEDVVSSFPKDNACPAVPFLFWNGAEEAVSSPLGDNACSSIASGDSAVSRPSFCSLPETKVSFFIPPTLLSPLGPDDDPCPFAPVVSSRPVESKTSVFSPGESTSSSCGRVIATPKGARLLRRRHLTTSTALTGQKQKKGMDLEKDMRIILEQY